LSKFEAAETGTTKALNSANDDMTWKKRSPGIPAGPK
jgi:hypothetical protein